MPLPPDIARITSDLLDLYDARLPNVVAGFYLVGSVALEDFQPRVSDVDFVAVVTSAPQIAALQTIHSAIADRHPSLSCDGIYVTMEDLSRPPAGLGIVAREGRVVSDSTEERHAVTWMTLRDHGVTVRGQRPHAGWIHASPDAVATYSRGNIASYWIPWIDKRRMLSTPDEPGLMQAEAIVWGVLGLPRLHAAITEGKVLSKSAAGRRALQLFPAHAGILGEALALRAGKPSHYGSPSARRDDALDFMSAVLASLD